MRANFDAIFEVKGALLLGCFTVAGARAGVAGLGVTNMHAHTMHKF